MKQSGPSVEAWADEDEINDRASNSDDLEDDDMLLETGIPSMGAKYSEDNGNKKDIVVAPKDSATAAARKEVKSKFKELINEKKKKQCNYEEVHALYKTQKKADKKSASSDSEVPQKKPPVPKFTADAFYISKPAVHMVEAFYEKYIKDETIIEKGIADGKFVEGTLFFDTTLKNKWDAYVNV